MLVCRPGGAVADGSPGAQFNGSESADATHLAVKPSDPKLKGEESKVRLSANLAEPAFLEHALRFEFRQVASPTSTFGAAR